MMKDYEGFLPICAELPYLHGAAIEALWHCNEGEIPTNAAAFLLAAIASPIAGITITKANQLVTLLLTRFKNERKPDVLLLTHVVSMAGGCETSRDQVIHRLHDGGWLSSIAANMLLSDDLG